MQKQKDAIWTQDRWLSLYLQMPKCCATGPLKNRNESERLIYLHEIYVALLHMQTTVSLSSFSSLVVTHHAASRSEGFWPSVHDAPAQTSRVPHWVKSEMKSERMSREWRVQCGEVVPVGWALHDDVSTVISEAFHCASDVACHLQIVSLELLPVARPKASSLYWTATTSRVYILKIHGPLTWSITWNPSCDFLKMSFFTWDQRGKPATKTRLRQNIWLRKQVSYESEWTTNEIWSMMKWWR